MAVFRHGPKIEDHYSQIPNDLARNPDISLAAKGLYAYLSSHREGWAMSTERVGEALGAHRNTIAKYVKELEESGYLEKELVKDESGKYEGIEYIIHSMPLHKKSATDSHCTKTRRAVKTGSGEIVQHKKTNSFKKNKDLKEEQGASRIPEDFYPKNFDALAKKYPNLDLDSVLDEFKTYWESNTTAKAKKKDWDRTFAVWCSRQKPKRMTREQKLDRMAGWRTTTPSRVLDEEAPF